MTSRTTRKKGRTQRIRWMMDKIGIAQSTDFPKAMEMIAEHLQVPMCGHTIGKRRNYISRMIITKVSDCPGYPGQKTTPRRGYRWNVLSASNNTDTQFTDDVRDSFYASWEWKRLRYDFLKLKERRCQCCNANAASGTKIVVDHIKPIRLHWHLRLDMTNLQILCDDCNMGKGSRDQTDWRNAV